MPVLHGGDKVENYLKRLAEKLAKPRTLQVGFLENATYPNGTKVALVATIQDFGAPAAGIPPRPFFRNFIKQNKGGWPLLIASALKARDNDVDSALQLVGEIMRGQVQQSIIDTNSPPLAQSTIDRKGFDKPLIDTSHMINSVAFQVKGVV